MHSTFSIIFKIMVIFVSLVALVFQSFPLSSLSAQVHSPQFYSYSIGFDYSNINFANYYENYTYEPFKQPYDPSTSRLSRYYRLGYFGTASSDSVPESFQIVPLDYTVAIFQKQYYERLFNPQLSTAFLDQNYNPLNVTVHVPPGLDSVSAKSKVNGQYLASFILMIMSAAFIGIEAILSCVSLYLKQSNVAMEWIIFAFLLSSFIVLLVSGALITELNQFIISKYYAVYDSWGIKASLGNGYFYIFLWIAVGLELFLILSLVVNIVMGQKVHNGTTYDKNLDDRESFY